MFFDVALASGLMWGHTRECGCGICACFPRVFALVALVNPSPGYVPWAADRLRLLEADLRDEFATPRGSCRY